MTCVEAFISKLERSRMGWCTALIIANYRLAVLTLI